MPQYELPVAVSEFIQFEASREEPGSARRVSFAHVVLDALERFPQECANCGRLPADHIATPRARICREAENPA